MTDNSYYLTSYASLLVKFVFSTYCINNVSICIQGRTGKHDKNTIMTWDRGIKIHAETT